MPAPLPPGPGWPRAAQASYWIYRPVSFLEYCRKRFGDCYTCRFPGHPPLVFIAAPQVVREIFAGDPDVLHAGASNSMLKPVLGRHSLLVLDGSEHRRERKRLMLPFQGERMRAYGETMQRITDAEIERWSTADPFAVHPAMQRLTLDVILQTVLGLEDRQRRDDLHRAIVALAQFTTRPTLLFTVRASGEMAFPALQRRLGRLSPLHRFMRLRAAVDTLLYDEIRRRRRKNASTGGTDILSRLMDGPAGDPPSDEVLRDQMLTLIVAGHETTATALCWVLWHIHRRPELLDSLRDEVASHGSGEASAVGELRLLPAVIHESLRLNPVIPLVVRLLRAPQRLGDLELPAGVIAAPNIFMIHRQPSMWEEPQSFRPQRFLERQPRGFAYLPFGGGARTCIGMAFAYYEMKIVLARLLARTRMTLAPGYRARVVRRSITFAPSRGMPMRLERREG